MKQTKDKIFIDSNIIIYSFGSDDNKKQIANDLLKRNPIISIQVLNEVSNVLNRKLKLEIDKIKTAIDFLSKICKVKNITSQTIQYALDFADRYGYSYYDSLIISSAREHNCNILYSEDLNDGQMIEKKIKIINPFQI